MRRSIAMTALLVLLGTMLTGIGTAAAGGAPAAHTVGVVDTATGLWYLWDPLDGFDAFYFGDPGDVPFLGDWDCDGDETPGLYRRSDGFVYLRNSNSQGTADISFFFGNPGDEPLVGDFNGDKCDTVSVYRPGTSEVFVINKLGSGATGLGAADVSYIFGDPGDDPFVGDFDGDGIDTVGLHRQSTGRVYFRNSHASGIADADFIYGDSGDMIVAGDWTADGTDTVGIFRPADVAFHLRHTNSPGIGDETVHMDATGTLLPIAGSAGQSGMVTFDDFPCAAAAAYGGPTGLVATSPAPAAPSDAIGVLGLSVTSSPSCDRVVIGLGHSTTFPGAFFEAAAPAKSVPAGVTVTGHGNRIRVDMPGIERGRISRGTEFLAEPLAFVVRESFPEDDLYVDIHYPDYRMSRAFFLSAPARIVIDSVATTTPTGLRLGPVVGDGVYLRDPIDPTAAGVTGPVTVTGYARPFEASDGAFLRVAATGAPIEAIWSGCAQITGPPPGCVYGTSDYIEAWGEFSFTIESMPPGSYELFVADTSPLETAPVRGVSEIFTWK